MNAVIQIRPEPHALVETRIIAMARQVEAMIHAAIEALLGLDQTLAHSILEKQPAVSQLETVIESEILATLNAGLSPQQVRVAAAMLRVNQDLERLASLAAAIAQRVLAHAHSETTQLTELQPLAIAAAHVARKTLRALVHQDLLLASNAVASGALVDGYRSYVFDRLQATNTSLQDQPQASYLILASHYLEQIADHSSNVAESLLGWLDGQESPVQAVNRPFMSV